MGIAFVDWRLIPFAISIFVVGLVAAFLLGNLRDPMQAAVGLALVVGGSVTVVYKIPGHSTAELIFIPLEFTIAWVAGFALRERAEQAEAAEVRAEQAERERDTAARIAVAEERVRIARELHDIVAHAVSVMVLQVGAVRHKLPDALAEDRDALTSVERAGRTALAEMRGLLGRHAPRRRRSRAHPTAGPRRPRLTAGRDRPCRPARPVACRRRSRRAPTGIDLSAYRIVQEGLTNALKHARASNAEVTVRYRPDELQIEVRDDGDGQLDERRPRSWARRHPRAGQDLRRGDERRERERERLHPQHPPAAERRAPMTIRVLVADDQSMVRAGFRMLLSREQDIEVVAEASNGLEAVEKAARLRPKVVLMDIRMPELDGLEATRRIIAADAAARILILTTFDLDEYVYEALRAGASGFVLKDDPPEQLLAAVRTIAGGEALLSPAITKRVIKQFTRIPQSRAPKELDELTSANSTCFA